MNDLSHLMTKAMLGMALLGGAAACTGGQGDASREGEKVGNARESIGGTGRYELNQFAESMGVVNITTSFGFGSGVVWQSFNLTTAQGTFIISAGHVFSDVFDVANPSAVKLQLGTQSAVAKRIDKMPGTDLALVTTATPLGVGSPRNFNFFRILHTVDYFDFADNAEALWCWGYGPTAVGGAFGTLRAGWFFAHGYVPQGSGSVPNDILTIDASTDPTFAANVQHGDSGGPCFDSTGFELVGVFRLEVPASSGATSAGDITVMDSPVQQFLLAHRQL